MFEAYHSLAKVWTHPGVLTLEREGTFKSKRGGGGDSMDEFVVDDSDEDSDFEERSKKRAKGNGVITVQSSR